MPIEYLTFRNKLILKITSEEGYPKIQIGIKKAKLILENIQAIEDFAKATEAQESPKEDINT